MIHTKDRRTGVKQLRVRGFKNVAFCATLKVAGINLIRATAFSNRKNSGVPDPNTPVWPFLHFVHSCGGALNKFRGRLSALLEQIPLLPAHALQSLLSLRKRGALSYCGTIFP